MRESSKREEAARGKGEAEAERAEWNWTPGRSFVAAKWVVPSFETMLRRLWKGRESAMEFKRRRERRRSAPFVDVVERGTIAVVVEVDVDERLRVLSETTNEGKKEALLPNRRIAHLKDGKKDLVEEHLDFLLELLPHTAKHPAEDLARELENLDHRRDGVAGEGEAEVLLHGGEERRSVARGGRDDGDVRVDEEVHVVVEDGKDEVEGKELRTHRGRLEVSLGFGTERLHGELGEGAEDEEGVFDVEVVGGDLGDDGSAVEAGEVLPGKGEEKSASLLGREEGKRIGSTHLVTFSPSPSTFALSPFSFEIETRGVCTFSSPLTFSFSPSCSVSSPSSALGSSFFSPLSSSSSAGSCAGTFGVSGSTSSPPATVSSSSFSVVSPSPSTDTGFSPPSSATLARSVRLAFRLPAAKLPPCVAPAALPTPSPPA
jgi:hypothetical protein